MNDGFNDGVVLDEHPRHRDLLTDGDQYGAAAFTESENPIAPETIPRKHIAD